MRGYTEHDYSLLIADWRNKYSKNTISIYSRHLRVFFNYCFKKKWIVENPIQQMPVEKKDIRAIPKEDMNTILDYLKQNNLDGYNILKFLYITGCRIGEAVSLLWSDVDFNNKVLLIRNQKAGRTDRFPLHKELNELLSSLPKDTDKVFPYISRHSFKFFRRTQITLFGEQRYNLHQLRKSFISMLVNSELKHLDVLLLARHSNIKTTLNHYIDFNISRLNKELSDLEF